MPRRKKVDLSGATNVDSEKLADAIINNMKRSGLSRFDVLIEDHDGNPITTIPGIAAQTRSEAINRAKQMLLYHAERAK